jgi:hypothetical protein
MENPVEHFCHFHPTSPARWRCSKCSRHFDHACVSTLNTGKPANTSQCPFCSAPLEPLTKPIKQNEQNLYKTHMLSSPGVLLLCGSAFLAAVSTFSGLQPFLLLALNQLTVFMLCFYYGQQTVFAKLLTAASGKQQRYLKSKGPGPIQRLRSSIKPALTFSALFLAPVYVFYQFHWIAGLLLILVAAMLAPCLMLLLLHQTDTYQQFELKKLFTELFQRGKSCFAQTLLLYCVSLVIIDFSFLFAPQTMTQPIASAVTAAALLIFLLDFTQLYIRLTAEMANLQIKVTPAQASLTGKDREDKQPQLSGQIELALKTGNYAQAVSLLESALKQNRHSVLRRQQLYLLLTELNDNDKLSRYAELFLHWMLERGKTSEASQLLYRLRKHDPTFQLHDIELMNELARLFTRQKKYALVLWLAEGSHKRFKPSEALAALYMSASQVLITHFQDLTKAEEYLLFVIRQCSGASTAEAAKALLIHLKNTQAREQQLRE